MRHSLSVFTVSSQCNTPTHTQTHIQIKTHIRDIRTYKHIRTYKYTQVQIQEETRSPLSLSSSLALSGPEVAQRTLRDPAFEEVGMNSSAKAEAGAPKDIDGSSDGKPTKDLAPVWVAAFGASRVRLAEVDSQKPFQRGPSAVTGSAAERENNHIKAEGPTEEKTPPPARNSLPMPPTPPPKVKLNLSTSRTNSVTYDESFIVDSSPRQTNNSSLPINALPNPDPYFNPPPHLNSSSTPAVDYASAHGKLSRLRGARGRADTKNGVMREQRSKINAEMGARIPPALPLLPNMRNELSSGRDSTTSQSPTQLLPAPQTSTRSGAHSSGHPARGSASATHQPHPRSRTGVDQLRRSPRFQESGRTAPNPPAPHRLASRRSAPRQSAQHASWNLLSQQLHQNGAAVRRENDWTTWVEITIRVYGLTPIVSTLDLWKCFNREGPITTIKIFEDGKGNRDGKASIQFRLVSPPNTYKQYTLLNVEIAHHQQRCSGIPKNILLPLKAKGPFLFGWSLTSPDGYTQFLPLLIRRISIRKSW